MSGVCVCVWVNVSECVCVCVYVCVCCAYKRLHPFVIGLLICLVCVHECV